MNGLLVLWCKGS